MVKVLADGPRRAVLDALTLGFAQDPVMRWLFKEADTYMRAFPQVLELFGGAAFAHQAALSTEDRSAAALWLPPGTHPDGEGLMALFEAELSKADFADAIEVFEMMDEVHPSAPCWHLAFVACDPVGRGKGYGAALMDHVLRQCDSEGTLAYLENTNPANTGFYEKHGFETLAKLQAGNFPPMWAMQRPPQSPAR